MKSFKDMRNQIDEVLKKSDDIGKWISDFVHSDDPKFKGKSKDERIKMAKGAYYAAQRNEETQCWDGYKKQGTKIGKSGKVVNNCVKENVEALKKKAEKSGVSLSVLKKVYARGVAAWNSGHRPGTTPEQWGLARVNSYITKGKGTYHGADKDLRESKTIKVDHTAIMDQKNASYILVQDRKCIAKGTKEEMLKLHEEIPNSRVWVSTANVDDLVEEKNHPYFKGLSKSTIAKRKAHWKKKDKLSDKDPAAYEPAPGDANAKTKESKHTKKYKELYGEMKYEVKHLDSYKDGQQAAKDGKKYSDNPHPKNSKAHLNWSKGHNAHRAKQLGEQQSPEAAEKANKKAQMAAKHADEKEALAKKQAREREQMKEVYDHEERIARDTVKNPSKGLLGGPSASEAEGILRSKYKYDDKRIAKLKESSAAKIVKTKLSTMANKNVRIPSPAERRAEIEKRKQMKEDTDMLSFDDYLQEDMRIGKAASFAKKYAGDMKTAVKKIEGIRKGLTNHPKVKDALKKANEELTDKQKKIDHNKNGKIDAADLATLRSKKKDVNELDKSTLKSYADKAHQAAQDHQYDAEHQYNDKKEQEYSRKMAAKRAAGAAKADAKLKEDTVTYKHKDTGAKMSSKNLTDIGAKSLAMQLKSQQHKEVQIHQEETELDEGLLDKLANKVTNYTMNKMAKNNPKAHAKFQKAQAAGVFNMKKEEEELDELSKKTLGSYVKKASFNAAQAAYQAGGSNGRIDKLGPHMDKLNKRTAGVNKATDKLTKEDVEIEETKELKSYQDFINEMDNAKRYVHKGTRYGGSAQRDDDHEKDFGHDDEKEKFRRLLQKKPEKKPEPQASTVKRGRGRPTGSKSGARDYYNKK